MAIGTLRRRVLHVTAATFFCAALTWYASSGQGQNVKSAMVRFVGPRLASLQLQAKSPCENDGGTKGWPLFPQFLQARRVEPSSSDLPPLADVFATGSPCALADSPKHLRPTVHFILDLHQPDEGKRIDDQYKRWFPEPTYSAASYRCVFFNGTRRPVARTNNHDKRRWPNHGDCSQAGRFRLVVLTCAIPPHLAVASLDESQPQLSVRLERQAGDGKVATTSDIPISCRPRQDDDDCKPMHEARKPVRRRKESVGICTMVKDVDGCALQEWLEYYRFTGVGGAYIFDNSKGGDATHLKTVLAPWLAGKFATILRWPPQGGLWWISQTKAVNSCLRRFSAQHRWIIVSDLDERMVPLQKPRHFTISTRAQSLLSYVLGKHVAKLRESVSSLIVRNWDMRGEGDGKGVCTDSGSLLIEQGTSQCKDGPSVDRMKSIFSTDLDEDEVIDQGHCTVIGLAPSELNPRREVRMNHYWSNTATQCQKWESAPGRLLTSSRTFRALLRTQLATTADDPTRVLTAIGEDDAGVYPLNTR